MMKLILCLPGKEVKHKLPKFAVGKHNTSKIEGTVASYFRSHAFTRFVVGGPVANETTTLYSMVVDDLAEAKAASFLRRYIQRTDVIYRESEIRSFKDAAVFEAFQGYLMDRSDSRCIRACS
jgi:hypothetical protein